MFTIISRSRPTCLHARRGKNYISTERLAKEKLGTVAKESIFMKTITNNFTPYYAPLIPLLNRLRKAVFPKDKP
ncbi:hypothetical protein C8A01DRAFT_19530 [Parachaetomium inaequale]|uniref:Uncharacterized protein n=1 Tax=Parachaetomium inaequale TaxID=2588326 RepID=A0AAN6P876_9PEZI|nr:hypothetical protein C8A01DRAFT_19530 [Parachaetomium inaequale]